MRTFDDEFQHFCRFSNFEIRGKIKIKKCIDGYVCKVPRMIIYIKTYYTYFKNQSKFMASYKLIKMIEDGIFN